MMLIEEVRQALTRVIDPEMGIDLVNLGSVCSIDVEEERVRIEITTVTPASSMGETLRENVREAVTAVIPEGFSVEVVLVDTPAWTPDRMTREGRWLMGWEGEGKKEEEEPEE